MGLPAQECGPDGRGGGGSQAAVVAVGPLPAPPGRLEGACSPHAGRTLEVVILSLGVSERRTR